MTAKGSLSQHITRRSFVSGSAAFVCAQSLAQTTGMATGGAARPQTRRPASGRPYSQFVDVAKHAGLLQPAIYGEVEKIRYIVESMGGGCAFFDFDNDGWMDIFLLSGTRLEGAPAAATNRLYRNNRDGTFTDVTERAGLQSSGWACGVCVGDFNNDGFEDLFVTFYGQNRLYRNNGNGTFTDVTGHAGLKESQTRFSTGCSFVDYNRDGLLDLFVANYVEFDMQHPPEPSITNPTCSFEGIPVYCGPRGLRPGKHSLYRNNGDGTFTDVSIESGIAKLHDSYGLTTVTGDFDKDGWPDIFVACDSTPSILLMNNRDGTFRNEAFERGVAVSGDGDEQAGMGVAAGDPFNQGSTSLFVTHFQRETNGLYLNNGKGEFTDITLKVQLGVETRYVGWGATIGDFDNNGDPDIFWVNGNVYPELEKRFPQFPFKGPRLLFRNLGDRTFEELTTEAGPALATLHASRGSAVGDFDNDGDLDILVLNVNAAPTLLRNDAPAQNHWLKVRLIGTKSNRSGIGAKVTVHFGEHSQMQELTSQSSYLSANDPRLHFGLGAVPMASMEIVWPSGQHQSFQGIHANQLVTVEEGKGLGANRAPVGVKASA